MPAPPKGVQTLSLIENTNIQKKKSVLWPLFLDLLENSAGNVSRLHQRLIWRRELRANELPRSWSGLSPEGLWGDTPPTVAAPPLPLPGEGILPPSWQGAGDPGPGDLGAPREAAGGAGLWREDAVSSRGRRMRSDGDTAPLRGQVPARWHRLCWNPQPAM